MRADRRIRRQADFDRVFAKGTGTKMEGLLLKAAPGAGPSRFGIVVGKKAAKQAVRRNRMRRLIWEAIRKHEAELRENRDAVFVALPGFRASSLKEAEPIVASLLKKARLLASSHV